MPSYFLGWYIMDKWGRRWILFGTMMVQCTALRSDQLLEIDVLYWLKWMKAMCLVQVGGLSCIACIFVPESADPWWIVSLAMVGKFQIALSFAVIYGGFSQQPRPPYCDVQCMPGS